MKLKKILASVMAGAMVVTSVVPSGIGGITEVFASESDQTDMVDIDCNGFFTTHTPGIQIEPGKKVTITYINTTHADADATANWKGPLYVMYYGDEAKVKGDGYWELYVSRADNWGWQAEQKDFPVTTEKFERTYEQTPDWAEYRAALKGGAAGTITVTRGLSKVIIKSLIAGTEKTLICTGLDTAKTLYVSLTGEDTKLSGISYTTENLNFKEPEWNWEDDFSAATATFSTEDESFSETLDAEIEESEDYEPATCGSQGLGTLTAKVNFNGTVKTDEKTDFPTLGHKYKFSKWEWTDSPVGATAVFVCENDPEHTTRRPATVSTSVASATCDTDGYLTYTATCTIPADDPELDFGEEKTFTGTKNITLPKSGHHYGAPVWNWSDDYKKATATFTCSTDSSHTVTLDADVTVTETTATCTEGGTTTFVATVKGLGSEFAQSSYTDTKAGVDAGALGHDYKASWAWAADFSSADVTLTCQRDPSHVETLKAEVTSEKVEGSTTEDAKMVYTAKVTVDGKEFSDTKTKVLKEKTGNLPDMDCIGWWGIHSEGIGLGDGDEMTITYKNTTKNDVNDNFKCPVFVLYQGDEPKVNGSGYDEKFVMRADNFGWYYGQPGEILSLDEGGFDNFVDDLKAGAEGTFTAVRKGDVVTFKSTIAGVTCHVDLDKITLDKSKALYVSISGEDTKLTNINYSVKSPEKENTDEKKTYGAPTWTWSEDGKTASAAFTNTEDAADVQTVAAAVTSTVTKEATADAEGEMTCTAVVSFQDQEYKDTKTVVIPKTDKKDDNNNDNKDDNNEKKDDNNNDNKDDNKEDNVKTYGDPVWTWSDDAKSASASFTNTKDATDVQKVDAAVTSKVTKEATVDAEGEMTYTAKVTFNGKEYTSTKTVSIAKKEAEIKELKDSAITLTAKTVTYNGKAVAIGAAKVTGSTGKVTYLYYSDAACTKAVSSPKNTGTYYVKAAVAADENYKAATSSAVTLVIKKAAQKISGVKTKFTAKKKLKKTQTFTIGGKASTKLSYKKVSGNKKISVSNAGKITVAKKMKKGTYKIKVKVTAKAGTNYTTKNATKTIKVVVK